MNREWADEFGLNYAQMQFVQDAIPESDENGYSQALLGIDGEWRGREVQALPKETDVIENRADVITPGTDATEAEASADDD